MLDYFKDWAARKEIKFELSTVGHPQIDSHVDIAIKAIL